MSEEDVIKVNMAFSVVCTEIVLLALNIITNFEHLELGALTLLIAIGMALLLAWL